ncbi:MAG: hypothetical protein Q9213_000315 [Squamulea squamosa]
MAPLDTPTPQNCNALQALFSHLGIPSEFIAERIHQVTHSFGQYQEKNSDHELAQGVDGKPSIQDPPGSQPSQEEDDTWLKSGVFLRWKQSTNDKDDASEVDMIIFNPTVSLQKNLESLVKHPDWRQALEDPYCLLVVVLDSLFKQVDAAICKVHTVLRSVEHSVLEKAGSGTTRVSFNFVAMYNIAKHVIHVHKSSSAAHLSACEVLEAHRQLMLLPDQLERSKVMSGVHGLIQHKVTLLEGCKLRAQSLDSRAQNMTSLAFNTVNQRDSQNMKSDSQSMKVIAVVTMVFLPAATVGSICGSQFFNFDSDNHKMLISVDFGFFWAVTIPLTVLVFGVYILWRRLKGNDVRLLERRRMSPKISP